MVKRAINAALLLIASTLFPGSWAAELLGYLLISAPRTQKISYVKLPADGNFAGLKPIDLITSGLSHPQGLAVDHKRKRLFVADPDAQKVFAYQLVVAGDSLTCDGKQTIVSENVESRWVAVDGLGNVFFSDEPKSRIMKITMSKILRGAMDAEIMYNGDSLTQVNKPGGVTVDNFHVFWTNKHFGTRSGTVVKGSEVLAPGKTPQESVSVLAANAPKSYGVCLALNNVFFTDSQNKVYGVKKNGGAVHTISKKLKSPRGCVWDGDGTVFVADRAQNAVYSFAGNMHQLTDADMTKAFDVEDAFGLAMLSRSHRAWSSWTLVTVIVAIISSLS
jgi:sugar lactone lactonase YvrE